MIRDILHPSPENRRPIAEISDDTIAQIWYLTPLQDETQKSVLMYPIVVKSGARGS